jgi:OmpA-OmpF porin, OOP family
MWNRLAATSVAVLAGLVVAGPAAAQKYTVHFGEKPAVSLTGHDDASHPPAEAVALSIKRAEAVKAAMVDNGGINAGGFTIKGQGRQQPLVQTADGVAERANRRVEISISCK